MATIRAADVKKLRDLTGAGMMDCKSALEEAGGNLEEATTVLRKKGLASAAKKAGRATSEGLIGPWMAPDRRAGILVEVNCESDFVARTDDFQLLVKDILAEIERAGDAATPEWLQDPGGPVQQRVALAISKLGENMAVPRFVRYAGGGHVGQYIHTGGKIGVQIELDAPVSVTAREEFATLVRELAMQVAAASPGYVSRTAVPGDVLEKERAIYRAQMEGSGKPAAVIEKIVDGKLGSFYAQTVLLEQPSIRDPKKTVEQVVAAAASAMGAPISITRFARLKIGEGA